MKWNVFVHFSFCLLLFVYGGKETIQNEKKNCHHTNLSASVNDCGAFGGLNSVLCYYLKKKTGHRHLRETWKSFSLTFERAQKRACATYFCARALHELESSVKALSMSYGAYASQVLPFTGGNWNGCLNEAATAAARDLASFHLEIGATFPFFRPFLLAHRGAACSSVPPFSSANLLDHCRCRPAHANGGQHERFGALRQGTLPFAFKGKR